MFSLRTRLPSITADWYTRGIAACVTGIACTAALCGDARGQPAPYPTFDQVPYAYAQDLGRFRNMFQEQARNGTVRVAWLGDSQETSPGGQGTVYVPRLGYEFFHRYGNVPETQLSVPAVYGAGKPPGAEFLLRGSTLSAQASRLAPSQVPPSLGVFGFRDASAKAYPYLTHLAHDGQGTGAVLRAQDYFKTGYRPDGGGPLLYPYGSVNAQVFAVAAPGGSGEVVWEARPHNADGPTFFTPAAASGTTSMGLSGGSGVKSQTVTLPFTPGNPYQQVLLYGSSPTVATDIVGVRFRSNVDFKGVAVQDLSAGGYLTSSYLANHAGSGPIFKALDFDAAVLHYGANDAASRTAEQFKADQEALIAAVRSWTGDPQFKVILAGDPYREGLSPSQQAEYDRYAGAQKSVADADPNVMVLNGRRLTHDIGWAAGPQSGTWLSDGVHYTATGARALAAREVLALMGESTLRGDVDLNGRVDSTDFVTLAANFGRSGREWHEGDVNYDGTVDSSDFVLLAANFGRTSDGAASFPEPGTSGCLLAVTSRLLLARRRRSGRHGPNDAVG